MDEQVFLVGVVLGLVVHEGGVLQQPQSVGGDAAAQPGGRGRGLGSHRRGQRHRGLRVRQTEGSVVGEWLNAEIDNIVSKNICSQVKKYF